MSGIARWLICVAAVAFLARRQLAFERHVARELREAVEARDREYRRWAERLVRDIEKAFGRTGVERSQVPRGAGR